MLLLLWAGLILFAACVSSAALNNTNHGDGLPGQSENQTSIYFYSYADKSHTRNLFQVLEVYSASNASLAYQTWHMMGSLDLLIHYNHRPQSSREDLEPLRSWLTQPAILSKVPDFYGEDHSEHGTYDKPQLQGDVAKILRSSPLNSTFDDCKVLYRCLYSVLPTYHVIEGIPFQTANPNDIISIHDCLSDLYNVTTQLTCPLTLTGVNQDLSLNCAGSQSITSDYWFKFFVDDQLDVFMTSGVDYNGIWWPGLKTIPQQTGVYHPDPYPDSYSFANAFGRQVLGSPSFDCSLETKCSSASDCRSVGSRTALGLGSIVYPEFWTFAVLTALENISTQLSNQYIAIKGAAIAATLGTFKITDFYFIPLPSYSLLNILSGLGLAFSILGGFLPIGGTIFNAASATIGATSGYLGHFVTNSTASRVPQEVYSDAVLKIYASFVDGLDALGKVLFTGRPIYGNFTIATMMQHGGWVDVSVLQPLNNTETSLAREIISRSVNELWKTPPYNKMFVTFFDLHDNTTTKAACNQDTTGPRMFRYCGDGGVYYAYNWIEDGHGQAHLAQPWGADKLQAKYDIDPAWVTEASAKTYQLSRRKNTTIKNAFNVTGEQATAAFIDFSLANGNLLDPTSFAGRSPGSWSLPVCDTGIWGKKWNWDYVNGNPKEIEIAPCMCGPDGLETSAFVQAAGLNGSGAYYRTCKDALTDKLWGFQWPVGVTEVDLGFNAKIQRPKNN